MILPADFVARTQALIGKEEFRQLTEALHEETPVSIRINRAKGIPAPIDGKIPWTDTGFYLPERLSFTFDPVFHAGAYYVQEASSMFLEQAIQQYVHERVKCLDLCAAPGGKSTHLLSILPEGSLLVSNEVIRNRSQILAENILKWGNPYAVVTQNDPEEIGRLNHLFDVIVTDVPCSGEGMFRKDKDSVGEWSVANVNLCSSRQRRIVHDIWGALKPGGLLIYSTCTYNTEENEENIHYITEEFGAEVLPVPHLEQWKVTGALKYDFPVYRFFPHKTKGEGFFLAILRKPSGETEEIRLRSGNKKEKTKAPITVSAEIKEWLKDKENFHWHLQGQELRAIPREYKETIHLLADRLHLLTAGVPIGAYKGKDFIPNHALALSTSLKEGVFPSVELSWEDAIRFLRKETLLLPDSTEKGFILVTYKGKHLGFVKNLGNRANNLYPSEWRIRSGYMPTDVRLFT